MKPSVLRKGVARVIIFSAFFFLINLRFLLQLQVAITVVGFQKGHMLTILL